MGLKYEEIQSINIPKDIKVNINDIEEFTPTEVIDNNKQNMVKF